jgi:hypothetical protein
MKLHGARLEVPVAQQVGLVLAHRGRPRQSAVGFASHPRWHNLISAT